MIKLSSLVPFLIFSTWLMLSGEMAISQERLTLSLEEAKTTALVNNRNIELQKQSIGYAEGDIIKEKGAFDPFLRLNTSYSNIESPVISAFNESGRLTEKRFNIENSVTGRLSTGTFYDLYSFSVSRVESDSPVESLNPELFTSLGFGIGQELLKNFGVSVNRARLFVARKNLEISRVRFEKVVSDVLFETEQYYWDLVASIQNVKLEKSALELAEDLEQRNTVEVEVGTLPSVAITQAKSEVAFRNVSLLNEKNLMERAEDKLKNALGLVYSIKVVPTEKPEIYIEENIDENEALATAFKNRPELAEVLLDIEKSKRLVRFYSNQKLPNLTVNAFLQFQGVGGDERSDRLFFNAQKEPIQDSFLGESKAFNTLVNRDFPGWSVMGTFTYPLFNRDAKGDHIKAVAEMNRQMISYKKVKEQIELEVRDAIREVRNGRKRIDATQKAVELAEEVVMNDEERLKVGIATTREVLEAQRDLIYAQTARVEAIAQYNISIAALEKAKGTLLLKNNVVIKDNGNFNVGLVQ